MRLEQFHGCANAGDGADLGTDALLYLLCPGGIQVLCYLYEAGAVRHGVPVQEFGMRPR